jgi:hypothetical protein
MTWIIKRTLLENVHSLSDCVTLHILHVSSWVKAVCRAFECELVTAQFHCMGTDINSIEVRKCV